MNTMPGQLSLFDLPGEPSPAEYVASISSPYWTTSWDKIKAVMAQDIKDITHVVKNEFCPYGCAGHYGSDGKYIGYDMRPGRITVYLSPVHEDEYSGGEVKVKWEDFAREVIDLIWKGERGKE